MKSYGITHREELSTDKIIFTQENPCDVVNILKRKPGKNIWICGGANIARQLMRSDLIDVYHIAIIPTILGSGARLFEEIGREIKLKLIDTQIYNGITELVYERR